MSDCTCCLGNKKIYLGEEEGRGEWVPCPKCQVSYKKYEYFFFGFIKGKPVNFSAVADEPISSFLHIKEIQGKISSQLVISNFQLLREYESTSGSTKPE